MTDFIVSGRGMEAAPLSVIGAPVEVWLNEITKVAEPFVRIPVVDGRMRSVRFVIEFDAGPNGSDGYRLSLR